MGISVTGWRYEQMLCIAIRKLIKRQKDTVLSWGRFIPNWGAVKQERWSTGQPFAQFVLLRLFQSLPCLTVSMQPSAKPPNHPLCLRRNNFAFFWHSGLSDFYIILLGCLSIRPLFATWNGEFCKEAFWNWTFGFSGESSCGFTSQLMKASPTMKWWFSIPVLYWASPGCGCQSMETGLKIYLRNLNQCQHGNLFLKCHPTHHKTILSTVVKPSWLSQFPNIWLAIE